MVCAKCQAWERAVQVPVRPVPFAELLARLVAGDDSPEIRTHCLKLRRRASEEDIRLYFKDKKRLKAWVNVLIDAALRDRLRRHQPAAHLLQVTAMAMSWPDVRDELARKLASTSRHDSTGVAAVLNLVASQPYAAAVASSCVVSCRASVADDPGALADDVYHFLAANSSKIFNNLCYVESYCGITELINALPLLYHMADTAQGRQRLSPVLVTLLVYYVSQVVHTTHLSDFTDDVPKPTEEYPLLEGCDVLVDIDAGTGLATTKPFSFATCALLEILGRWATRGVEVATVAHPQEGDLAAVINTYVDRPGDEYTRGWLKDVLDRDSRYAYAFDIARALVQRRTPRVPKKRALLYAALLPFH